MVMTPEQLVAMAALQPAQQPVQNFGMQVAGYPVAGGVPNSQPLASNDEIDAQVKAYGNQQALNMGLEAPTQTPNIHAGRDMYQGMMQGAYNQMQGGGFQGGMLNSSYANPWSAQSAQGQNPLGANQNGASWTMPQAAQAAPAWGASAPAGASTWGGPFGNTNAWGQGS